MAIVKISKGKFMNYEDLLMQADSAGATVKEKPLLYNDGRQKGRWIAIRKSIPTSAGKACPG